MAVTELARTQPTPPSAAPVASAPKSPNPDATPGSLSQSDSAKWSGLLKGAVVGAGAMGAGMAIIPFVGEAIYPMHIAKVSLKEGIVFRSALEKSFFLQDMAEGAAGGAVFGAFAGAIAGYQVGKHATNPTEGAKMGANAGLTVGVVMGLAAVATAGVEVLPGVVIATGITTGLGALCGYFSAPRPEQP